MATPTKLKPATDMPANKVGVERDSVLQGLADRSPEEFDSSHKVIRVAELFERVLMHVPNQDLVISASLVCTEWKQMIDTSPRLIPRNIIGTTKLRTTALCNHGNNALPNLINQVARQRADGNTRGSEKRA
ncbi:hypothetical protein CERZMDRAFT_86574 [Cercospora zeae-maydis SCOH1-5]|uniref:F-box domain-containing protein n=1 Tax=Cercospora zeae-maydis SCOH1-5 TaxID=717836 RepID=A0A6A6F968_9PEZI|nr:hypothetical protein CERZMDRAFT_86574 [Cercospora zeae-maydis SCOH1-5]